MATKAQRFRSEQERSAHPPRTKKQRPRRRDQLADTARPGVSATDRHAARSVQEFRNLNGLSERRGGASLEASTSGKRSRKSTRKSVDHVKRTTNLQNRAMRKTSSPKARAERAKVRAR